MDTTPLVSICCLAYNHSQFIRKSLDGFLMQETNFPIEILIHDDASTDGTDGIIKEYADKYPDLIFPIYETENQYSKRYSLAPSAMDIEYNYSRARGKYIAYCEGDDYWTDPKKLQKQVDFLETHLDYSVCWHRCRRHYLEDDRWEDDRCGKLIPSVADGVDIDIATFFSSWYTQPLTMVFRKSLYDFEWCNRYKYFRDEHELYHLLTVGKGFLFSFVGGVYVIQGGGIFGAQKLQNQSDMSCNIAKELYNKNKNEYTKRFYIDSLKWAIHQHKENFFKRIAYSWKLFCLDGSVKHLIKNSMR